MADRIVILEGEILALDHSFATLYRDQLQRERRHLLMQVDNRHFLRGLVLGSPGLAEEIRREAPKLGAAFAAGPTKWERSLLRFVTRATTKLSANSTLTSYALGTVADGASRDLAVGCPRASERSLVRIDRAEIEQLEVLLLRIGAVRERCRIVWNESVEELEPGLYRFLRDARWEVEGDCAFRRVPAAKVKLPLSSDQIDSLRQELTREPAPSYDELLHSLGNGTTASSLTEELDRLVELGFLVLLPPWSSHEPCLESRFARFLAGLSSCGSVAALSAVASRLVMAERRFAAAAEPDRALAELTAAFEELFRQAAAAAGFPALPPPRAHFFEDVLSAPARPDSTGAPWAVPAATVGRLLHASDLVARFAGLFNLRHDVLHTLAAWWRENLPARGEAPFIEVAHGFAPVWKEFPVVQRAAAESALTQFDPLNTPALTVLGEKRRELLVASARMIADSPGQGEISLEALAELVAGIPARYAPLVGPAIFVQPCDPRGDAWVLNRLSEGTGRYLSRVTPVLDAVGRRQLLDRLVASSTLRLDDEEADLLEVQYPWGHLVGVHPPQTYRVLALRGLALDLPRSRTVRLEDLRLRFDHEAETFRLVDAASGRRVLPVHLSSMADSGLPSLLRLLLLFGPAQTRGVQPFPFHRQNGAALVSHRLTCGILVLRRQHWRVPVEELRLRLAAVDGAAAFRAIHDWRQQLELPPVGFYYETTFHGAIKPQFVDFGSPTLCDLFSASLRRRTTSPLILEEALPTPADFPCDAAGRRRALELLIDSLALRDQSGNPSARCSGAERGDSSLRKEQQNV